MSYALGRPILLNLEAFAQVTQVHPDLITHFVTLGLLEPVQDATGGLWFDHAQRARLARVQRLRASFSINYTAIGLVVGLTVGLVIGATAAAIAASDVTDGINITLSCGGIGILVGGLVGSFAGVDFGTRREMG